MTVQPEGIYRGIYLLRKCLASCRRVQELTKKDSAADALENIMVFSIDDDTDPGPPRILLQSEDGFKRSRSGTATFGYQEDSLLVATFELHPPECDEIETLFDERTWFMNQIGQIVREAEILSSAQKEILGDNPINITGDEIIAGPEYITLAEVPNIEEPDSHKSINPTWIASIAFSVR